MKRYTVIDAHCDTASEILDRNEDLLQNTRHLSLEQTKGFSSYIQFYAAWISKNEKNPLLRAIQIIDKMKQEISKNADMIEEVHTAKETESVINRKKQGALLAIEDGRALCGSLSNLRMFYDLGVRTLTLAWNDDNELTDGIASKRGAGLTDFGKAVVREMNRLKMMVDVSHITERGFWDVMEESQAPVMASHSNAKSICGHRRNLTDEQIRALIEKKGIICVNLYPQFVSDEGKASFRDIVTHIAHILSLGGENYIGLGSDFDGVDSLPKDMEGVRDYTKLFEEMERYGLSDDLINKITHQNMLNFMKRIEK